MITKHLRLSNDTDESRRNVVVEPPPSPLSNFRFNTESNGPSVPEGIISLVVSTVGSHVIDNKPF